MLIFRHRLRLVEVPVTMRQRETGRSSITALPLALLHGQGLARALRRAASSASGPRQMTYSSGRLTFVAGFAVLVVLGVVIELIRRRRLQERYALLWIVTGLVMLVLAVWRGALYELARRSPASRIRRRRCTWSRASSCSSCSCTTRRCSRASRSRTRRSRSGSRCSSPSARTPASTIAAPPERRARPDITAGVGKSSSSPSFSSTTTAPIVCPPRSARSPGTRTPRASRGSSSTRARPTAAGRTSRSSGTRRARSASTRTSASAPAATAGAEAARGRLLAFVNFDSLVEEGWDARCGNSSRTSPSRSRPG